MKGAFETMGLFYFGMMFICLLAYGGINLAIYQQARCYQEVIVGVIEHNCDFNEDIKRQLDFSSKLCKQCEYVVTNSDQESFEYRIEVNYPIIIPVINYQSQLKLVTYALTRNKTE